MKRDVSLVTNLLVTNLYKLCLLLLLLCFCMVAFGGCASDADDVSGDGKVYVCSSSGSKVWHCQKNCSALKKCGGNIRETTISGLSSQYKKPCGICYK